MRGILVTIVALATFLLVTISLWRKRTSNISEIPADLESYWDGKTERRRGKRFKKELNVVCSVPEKKGNNYHLFSKDISGEGICLQVPEILPEGTVMDLKVNIPDGKPILVRGIVVWVSEFPNEAEQSERLFDTGIKLIKVDASDKQKFIDYLNSDTEKKEG